MCYLFVGARYEKVREAGQVRDDAVLMPSGVTFERERQMLGILVSISEHKMEGHFEESKRPTDTRNTV